LTNPLELKDLLSKIFVKEGSQRIVMDAMYNHPWVNLEEIGRPLFVPPMYDNLKEVGTDQILSITKVNKCTVFSFAKFQDDILSRVVTSHQTRRQSVDGDVPSPSSFARRFTLAATRRASLFRPSSANHAITSPPPLSAPQQTAAVDSRRSISIAAPITYVANTLIQNGSHDARFTQSKIDPTGEYNAAISNRDFRRGRRMSYQETVPHSAGFSRSKSISPTRISSTSGATKASTQMEPLADSPASGIPEIPVSGRRMSVVPVADFILYNMQETQSQGSSPIRGITAEVDETTLGEVNLKVITDYHSLHRLPKMIRSFRYTFTNTTTTSMPPSALFQEVHRVLLILQRQYPSLSFARPDIDYYVLTVRLPETGISGIAVGHSDDATTSAQQVSTAKLLVFELEVCKVWLLRLNGLRFKRLAGDPLLFKELYKDFVSRLNLT
jgi:hypothetical protein